MALSDINTTPTSGMKAEAKKGLAWRKEFNRGGTEVGVARARDIINGNLSVSTIKRMYSYFSRHEVDKKGKGFSPGEKGFPSAGRIAWALWGGDAGFSWSRKKVKEIKRQEVKNSWYQLEANADYADVYIYDEIGSHGVSAKDFIAELNEYKGKPLNIHINSGGGSVFEGQSMATAIRNHGGHVTTTIEGVAASMATIIALAADSVYMTENSLFMIHNPMLDSYGDKNELKKAISLLEKVETNMLNAYSTKTKLSKKEIAEMMNNETWFTAKEAVKAGFVDKVVNEVRVAANYDISGFKSKTEEEILNVLNGENKDKLNTTEMNDENKSWFAAQFDKLANLIGSTEIPEEFTAETVVNEEAVQETTEAVVEAATTPDLSDELQKVTEERDALLEQATVSEEEQLDYGKEIEAMRQRISQLEATPSTTLSAQEPKVMPDAPKEKNSWDSLADNIFKS